MAIGLNYFITCQGFPAVGMCTVLIGAITNIVLDPVFIFVFDMAWQGLPGYSNCPVCILCFCLLFSDWKKGSGGNYKIKKRNAFQKHYLPDFRIGIISIPDSGNRQCHYYYHEHCFAALRRSEGRRFAHYLRYHCTKLYDAHYRSHAWYFQRNPGYFKLQLRGKGYQTGAKGRALHFTFMPLFYFPDVPTVQNCPPILYWNFYQRPGTYRFMYLGHPHFYTYDCAPEFSVCFRGRLHCTGKKQNSAVPLLVPQG